MLTGILTKMKHAKTMKKLTKLAVKRSSIRIVFPQNLKIVARKMLHHKDLIGSDHFLDS